MKAIVTGANGFIGSNLIKKLVENNIEVTAIDISFNPSRLSENKLIKKIETSIDNLILSMLDEEYDLFFHFAWTGVNGTSKGDINVQLQNIKMTIKCAEVAKKVNCKKFLCAGTIAERNIESLHNLNKTGPGMFYGASKYSAHIMLETYCKNIGLNFIWMQFSNIFGPANKTGNLVSYTLSQIFEDKEASFGPANQPYDFIYVNDLINAVYLLGISKTKNNFYFIGSGTPRLLKDYLLSIGKIANKEKLIKVGVREDDGIKYDYSMFDINNLKNDIGNYISKSFEEAIKYTIENYHS